MIPQEIIFQRRLRSELPVAVVAGYRRSVILVLVSIDGDTVFLVYVFVCGFVLFIVLFVSCRLSFCRTCWNELRCATPSPWFPYFR
ncbi:hypothetical protein CEXT_45211 [Caerostris extrusa]|uniref:Uncharacterized protein n=1 Tax=Caerostris extrusa TaxID=172846 RepID=A0AAV4XAY9_CAEEX|nr:hypothetical protein CEXT_45211 [Caerostris extrusa]